MDVSPLTQFFSSIVHAIQYNCHVRLFGTSCFHRHVSSRFWNELYNSTKYKVGVLYYLGGLNSDRTVLPSWRDLSQGLLRGIGLCCNFFKGLSKARISMSSCSNLWPSSHLYNIPVMPLQCCVFPHIDQFRL